MLEENQINYHQRRDNNLDSFTFNNVESKKKLLDEYKDEAKYCRKNSDNRDFKQTKTK